MSSSAEKESSSYSLHYAKDRPEETKRLDDMHEAIKEYLGGALSFAPLKGKTPSNILELACGSGAWAIQSANLFPDAEVLATDLVQIPARDYPYNMKFQTLDITKPFPFRPGTFDIVHARFVLIHVPQLEDIVNRMIQLVKPGGWLLLEETDNLIKDDGGLGAGQKNFWSAIFNFLEGKGVNPLAGSTFEGLLKGSGAFSDVKIKKIAVPLSKPPDDTSMGKLGPALRRAYQGAVQGMSLKPEAFGTTQEVVKQFIDELDDPNRNMYVDLYFAWAEKNV